MKQPESASTPKQNSKVQCIQSRRGIHEEPFDYLSPIQPASSRNMSEGSSLHRDTVDYGRQSVNRSRASLDHDRHSFTHDRPPYNHYKESPDCHGQTSDKDEGSSTDNDEQSGLPHISHERETENARTTLKNSTASFPIVNVVSFLIGLVALGFITFQFLSSTSTKDIFSMEQILHNYPLQSKDLWIAVESGIQDVQTFNKPSVFLLLYDTTAEFTLNNMLLNLSQYATCVINQDCNLDPIVVTSRSLNTTKAIEDYGTVISEYKPQLEHKHVMVVKNLDEVPGVVAQAFHSMCDEYNPLVDKSVFFFTIKLAKRPEEDLAAVENVLRRKWGNLKEDIFDPLFTRISNMVLRVVPEK